MSDTLYPLIAASRIFNAALLAVDPCQAILNTVRGDHAGLSAGGETYSLDAYKRILVVGAGKATARMALALEILLGDKIAAGLIVVKKGHKASLEVIEQVEAAHPVPDEAGENATKRILTLLNSADENTLVICLLSGGASALLVAPVAGVTLQDKQVVTDRLLKAGATIGELNAVRKHLSAVKGGKLAQAAFPAQILSLILSDVVGDRLDVIASGPTAPDSSSFADALAVLEKYHLQQAVPSRVMRYLQRGSAGQEPETIKADDPCLRLTRNLIAGGIHQALDAAAEKAKQLGLTVRVITATLEGEARDVARYLAETARQAQAGMSAGERCCLLFGGETTVTVRGNGKGGRNQELALAFALEIEGQPGMTLLSAGTDGNDGLTDAAGALVDGNTALRARQLGIDPLACLQNNDSYGFFQQFDSLATASSHFKPGPTGTNVMDVQMILLM